MKKIFLATFAPLFGLSVVGGGVGAAFGLGFSSEQSISSVRTAINNHINKNHMIINPIPADEQDLQKDPNLVIGLLLRSFAVSELEQAYYTDALSTVNAQDWKNPELIKRYKRLAKQTFEQDWVNSGIVTLWKKVTFPNPLYTKYHLGPKNLSMNLHVMNKPINMNAFAQDLLNYDLTVAQHFKNPAYVELGYKWIFSNLGAKELLEPNYKSDPFYQAASRLADVKPDQMAYNQILDNVANQGGFEMPAKNWSHAGPLLNDFLNKSGNKSVNNLIKKPKTNDNGGLYSKMPDGHLINNKIWFVNRQVDKIQSVLKLDELLYKLAGTKTSAKDGLNLLSPNNMQWYQNHPLEHIEKGELVVPKYQQFYLITRIAAVFLIFLIPLLIIIGLMGGVYVWKIRPKKILKENEMYEIQSITEERVQETLLEAQKRITTNNDKKIAKKKTTLEIITNHKHK